jgi:PAS domain S-box-containing protein
MREAEPRTDPPPAGSPSQPAGGHASSRSAAVSGEQALRESEEALRRQKRQFATLVEHIPDIVARFDRNLHYLYISPAVEKVTGRPPEAYLGKPRTNAGLSRECALAREAVSRRVFETGQEALFEFPIETAGGQRFLEMRLIPEFSPDGTVESLMTLTRDITGRRQTEASLRRHSERFRLLWEAAAVLLTTDEPEAMLRGLFAKIAGSLGLDAYLNYMVAEGGDALRLVSCAGIPEESVPTISRLELGQAVCGTAAAEKRSIVVTGIHQTEEPMVRLVKGLGIRAYACFPLLAGHRLLGTLSFASRTREQFEPDEIEFLETLSQYVTAAYDRLRLIQQLQEADRRKDEFLATLAHELRNPLAPLRNGLQLIRLAADDPETVERSRGVMERQLAQLVRLVDDLMDISRITRGKIELRRERIDIGRVIERAVETARPLVEAKAHILTLDMPDAALSVDGDPTRLAQVISNLLHNAARYTERGGRITVAVRRQAGEVTISVLDTGAGIPEAMLLQVFELFSQVDRSLERSQGGLGIGLTLVKRLVELHGGSVTAQSDGEGRGSVFEVRLPICEGRMETAPPAGTTPSDFAGPAGIRESQIEPHTPARVLVVDDNRDAASTLAELLDTMGYPTRTARDGLEALEVAAVFQPHVIFLDLGMPRLNGYDTARRIRAEPWGREPLLVALTGWGQAEDRKRSGEAGFDVHLVKPVEPAVVRKLMATPRRAPAGGPQSFGVESAGGCA